VGVGAAGASPSWSVVPTPEARTRPPAGSRLVALSSPAPRSRLIPIVEGVPSSTAIAATGEQALPADAEAVTSSPLLLPYLMRPSLGGGMPSGFVGRWGDYFLSGSAGTPGNLRDGVPDGSINMGFAIGDPERTLGVEVYWGISSIKNFNDGGSLGVSAGRLLVNQPNLQVAAAGGLIDAITYSNEPGVTPINGYGALTAAIPLRPQNPNFQQMVQFTVGAGGYGFAQIDSNFATSDTGYFMAAGIEVLPNLGLSFGVSTRGKNVNVSYIPFRSLPIFVNLAGVDLFNETPWGTIGVLTVGWADNLKTGVFGVQR